VSAPKTNVLFSEPLSDEADRFDRVENAVQDIRDEFDKMSPSINRLISIESDIRELHDQLKILIDNGSLAKVSKSTKPQVKKFLDESDLKDIEPIDESDLHKEVSKVVTKKVDKEAIKDVVKEAVKETDKESIKEAVKEAVKETDKDAVKDAGKKISKEGGEESGSNFLPIMPLKVGNVLPEKPAAE